MNSFLNPDDGTEVVQIKQNQNIMEDKNELIN